MTRAPRTTGLLWLLTPLAALCLFVFLTARRLDRVHAVNALATWTSPAETVDTSSPTGFARGQRALIVPERNEKSLEWIVHTQLALARSTVQLRHVDYDNVPGGRAVNSPSLYRAWLGGVATLEHLARGTPLGQSVERAALIADPLLLALAILVFGGFCAWRFGGPAAACVALGLATLFPLAATFLPAVPDDRGASALLGLAAILPLLAGLRSAAPARWFALAGVLGGVGVWLHVPTGVPLILGLAGGAAAAVYLGRAQPGAGAFPRLWRIWALSGAITILAGFLLENFPGHLATWRLEAVHPLYGVAWLGLAELIVALGAPAALRQPRALVRLALGLLALGSVALAMRLTAGDGFLARDLLWTRLAFLPDSASALSLWAWCSGTAQPAAVVAVLAPLALVVAGIAFLFSRRTSPGGRAALALAVGPALVAAGIACVQLRWWAIFDAAALGVAVALVFSAEAAATWRRWLAPALLVIASGLGVWQQWPARIPAGGPTLTASESQEIIERHLAHWLTERTETPGAVIYAPPQVTLSLCYFGGLRGIGTFAPENQAGFSTSLAIAAAKTMEEAETLLRGRGVRYLVIPSWDPFFDNFAALYLSKDFSNRTSLLISELRRWNLPRWLRAVPYQLPVSGAFEGEAVRVFEVVDEQSPATADARLAEYLVETGDLASAGALAERLRRFPGDVGALAARVRVLAARGDTAAVAPALAQLQTRLATGADRFLAWDRRVSLALTLAQADQVEAAIAQTRRCLADADLAKLRTLSTASLYNLFLLTRAIGLEWSPSLRASALDLLPADLRANL